MDLLFLYIQDLHVILSCPPLSQDRTTAGFLAHGSMQYADTFIYTCAFN